jgi:hypothetical protein
MRIFLEEPEGKIPQEEGNVDVVIKLLNLSQLYNGGGGRVSSSCSRSNGGGGCWLIESEFLYF